MYYDISTLINVSDEQPAEYIHKCILSKNSTKSLLTYSDEKFLIILYQFKRNDIFIETKFITKSIRDKYLLHSKFLSISGNSLYNNRYLNNIGVEYESSDIEIMNRHSDLMLIDNLCGYEYFLKEYLEFLMKFGAG